MAGTLAETKGQIRRIYFQQNHAEPVPPVHANKPCNEFFYLPIHTVSKESRTTTQLRVIFDTSAKTTTGVSLNDQLLVGPTVHASLHDVLLKFRRHRIALATKISKMYHAALLPENQRHLHRFVWRSNPWHPLKDYCMTRLTFGVSTSSFATNMAVKQNTLLHASTYPLVVSVEPNHFYVDDRITGVNSVPKAIQLQQQLQEVFAEGGFLLRK